MYGELLTTKALLIFRAWMTVLYSVSTSTAKLPLRDYEEFQKYYNASVNKQPKFKGILLVEHNYGVEAKHNYEVQQLSPQDLKPRNPPSEEDKIIYCVCIYKLATSVT